MTADAQQRAAIIAGLRQLADTLEATPDLPVSLYWDLCVHAGVDTGDDGDDDAPRNARVDHAARILGTEITDRHGHHQTQRQFSGISYSVLSISSVHTAEYKARRSYHDNVQVPA